VVREFRRVPTPASALGLVIFAARLGREAQVVATLAHYAERALSLYPAALPAARALAGAARHHRAADGSAGDLDASSPGLATPFSVDHLLPEVSPLLAAEPEFYAYSPEPQPETVVSLTVSPYAV
jgi:hypothetical protein